MFKKFFSAIFILCCAAFGIISCNVGLGEAVDTEAPVMSITYPPAGAVIRDSFVLAGICNDDKGVSAVEVIVKNTETQEAMIFTDVQISGKNWQITLNEQQNGKWQFADGKYTIDVTGTDHSGRTSGVSSRSFEIDNTAPIFFVSSPNNTNMANASKYGSVFKVNGTITEDHSVKLMEVTVYDAQKNPLKQWTQSNVEIAGGTSVTFAKYDESNTTKETHTRYTEIYTSPDSNGNQSYYCSIRLVDSAKAYKNPSFKDVAGNNSTEGNETSCLWLNDSIRDNLMSATAIANLEPSDIKSVWNGTYTGTSITSEKQEEILTFLNDNICDTSAEGNKQLAFTLNKNASPKYDFIGYGFSGTDAGSHKSSKGATVGFNAVSGLNNTTFYPKELKVIFFGPFEKSDLTADFIAGLYSDPKGKLEALESKGQAACIKDFSEQERNTGSGTSFTADVVLPDNVESGKYYLLAAIGKDTEDFDFVANGQNYGFMGQASGTPPELIVSSPLNDSLSNAVANLVYTGTSKSSESNIASVSYEAVVYDLLNYDEENNPKEVGVITGNGTCTDGAFNSKSESWKCDLRTGTQEKKNGYTSCLPSEGCLYKYSVTITTTDVPGLYTSVTRTVTIDKMPPVFNKVSLTPVVSGTPEKINGKITVSGSVTERNPKQTVMTVSDCTTTKNYSFGDNTSFEQLVDSRIFGNGKTLTVKIVSTDKADNSTENTSLSYKIDQSTDIPSISSTGTLEDSSVITGWGMVTSENNMFGSKANNIFNVTVSDDDGLEAVYLKVTDKDGNLISGDGRTEGYTKTYSTNSAKSYALNYTVPAVQGNYKIEVKAVDTEFASEKTSVYYIGVYDNKMVLKLTKAQKSDDTQVALSNNEVVVSDGEELKLSGTLAITSKEHVSSIKLFKMKKNAAVWVKNPAALLADYVKDRTDDSIEVTGTTDSVSWKGTIPASGLTASDKEQHFVVEAEDIYGNLCEVELCCFVDDAVPSVAFLGDYSNWQNNSTQTITVVVGDISASGYSSGIEKVTCRVNGVAVSDDMSAGALCNSDGTSNANGLYRKYTSTVTLPEGTNSIDVIATDNVGKSNPQANKVIKIDTSSPVKTSLSMPSSLVKKASESVEVSFEWKDEKTGVSSVSGVASYKVYADQVTELGTVTVSPQNVSLSGLSDGTHKLYMKATDNAGNASGFEEIGTLTVDNTPPVVTLTSGTGSVLNKKVKIGGSITDANVASGTVPEIFWSSNGASWTKLNLTDCDGDSVTSSCDGSTWTAEIDTASINNTTSETQVYLCAVFTDAAGNVTSKPDSSSVAQAALSKTCAKVKIDQNTDRPEIKFTNIRTKITDSDPNSVNTNVINGTINDDDGLTSASGAVGLRLYRIFTETTESNGNTSSLEVEKEISVSADGSWSVTMDTAKEKEGTNSWKFRIVDVKGTEFKTVSSGQLARPYVTSKLDSTVYDNNQAVTFKYDITAPETSIKIGKGSVSGVETSSGSEVWDLDSTNLVLGGKNNYIWVNAVITEAVGMGSSSSDVTLTIKGKGNDGNSKAVTVYGTYNGSSQSNTVHNYSFFAEGTANSPAKLSDFANGSVQIIINATDKAGNYSQAFRNVTLDTEAPQVQIISPTTNMSDAVSSAISVKGLVQDEGGSAILSLKYMIPNIDQKALIEAGSVPVGGWKPLSTSASWEITFASGSNESSDSLIYYASAKDSSYIDASSNPEGFIYPITEVGEGTGIYKVPFYFLVEDSAGNSSVRTTDKNGNPLYVLVDSEGGKPTAWISSPENGATTSGYVTVYGGASDNVSVKKVEIKVNGGTPYEVTGTNSWKYTVDSNTDYLTKVVNGNTVKYMTFSVRAFDDDNQTRAWIEPVEVMIDGETPTIKNVKLVQKKSASGTVNVEREYVSGMYISDKLISSNGDWYLTADIADNVKVSSVEWTKMTSATHAMIDISPVNASPNAASYSLNQKLNIQDQSGQIYYVIKVKDSDNGEQTQTVIINVDSTAPSFYDTDNAEKMEPGNKLRLKSKLDNKALGTGTANSSVVNNNGFFTFGDIVGEAGSGLQYLAFYFKHTGSTASTTGIYNPMFEKGTGTTAANLTSINTTASNGKVYINSENLPALSLTGAARSSEDSIQHDSIKNNNNVRAGGLVKAGGIYSKILSVNRTTGTVTITPTVSTSFKNVEIVYAQIVDHMLTESIANDMTTVVNDDNDGMCETITQLGSSYNWTASICSSNIPDGPVEVHAVAIDNAGNSSHGYIETSVTNNRPRLTKVLIGTDLNGSNKYDFNAKDAKQIVTSIDEDKATPDGASFGEFSYYSAINPASGVSQSDVALQSGAFKVISGLAVIPEFVGGNGDIGYILKQSDSATSTDYVDYKTGTVTALTSKETLLLSTTDKGTYSLSNQVSDKGGLIITPSKPYIALTFWDKTDGTVQGTSSQWAHLMIPVTLMSSETNKPEPKIAPFYWNSNSENSVTINKKISGHIELEGDLESSVTSKTVTINGVQYTFGNDPKVSGKIKVQGTIYDDVRLTSISASVFGASYSLSSYTSGVWSKYTAGTNAYVESFTVDSDEISQEGHSVTYTMIVDTEKLGTGLDKEITLCATDWKNNVSVSGSVQTTKAQNTSYYKMDIVPYVTEIVTAMSPYYGAVHSVYARTAEGRYPVKEGEVIQFTGYNLGSNTAAVTIPGMTANRQLATGTVNGSSKANTVTLTESSSGVSGAISGEVLLTVGSIPALNNLNKNNACGSYETSDEEGNVLTVYADENYAHCYNRQPNGINNNELTDDLYLDVWQFKDAARPVNGGAEYVTMKINPKTGVPGFSYANSVLYFNMPAYNSNNTNSNAEWYRGPGNTTVSGSQYSQIPVGMNYGGFSHNSFCYDSYGYSYGAAMCTDTQNATASAFLQFFSRETPINYSNYDQNMNYVNCANASRIDSSTMNLGTSDSGNWQTNINRIQSISMDTSYSGGSSAPSAGTPVYVYIAYFDDIAKQVRFRWGTVGANTDNIDGKSTNTTQENAGSSWSGTRVGYSYGLDDIVDSKYSGYAQSYKSDGGTRPGSCDDSYIKYSNAKNNGVPVQVIAQGDITVSGTVASVYKQTTAYKAGKYVSMGVIGKTTSSPKVVVFWSDGLKLYMAYNESPLTSHTWTSKLIDDNGGLNVKCAVDSSNGIHVAYYTTNGGNLKYAYLSGYKADPSVCVVDAHGAVGTKCSIDVVKDSSGNQVPYISYQLIGGVSTYNAKIAYRTDFTSSTFEGSDENDFYTGKWEISIVPTSSLLKDDTVNVGLWRNSDGTAKAFTSNTYWKSKDVLSYGGTAGSSSFTSVSNGTMNVGSPSIIYGNNTANPIIGYGVESGAIEIAQKK